MIKNLLFLAGFSTFVVIVIVGLDIYHKSKISSLQPSTQRRVIPITPTFDKEALENLKQREPIAVDLSEGSTVISEDSKNAVPGQLTPVPTQASSPIASQSAFPDDSPIIQP